MMRSAAIGLLLAGVLAFPACAASKSKNDQVREALHRPLPSVLSIDLRNIALRDAITFVSDMTGLSIHVNWKAIDAAGIQADAPVTVRLRNVSARKVLNTILSDASTTEQKLAWYIDEGTIEITSREQADGMTYVLVYEVQDLLINYPEDQGMNGLFNPMMLGMNMQGGNYPGSYPGNNSGTRGIRRSGRDYGGMNQWNMGPSSMSPWNTGTNPWMSPMNQTQNPTQKATTKADELVDLIKATIFPKYWEDGRASIKFYNGSLVVTAPRIVHEALGGPID